MFNDGPSMRLKRCAKSARNMKLILFGLLLFLPVLLCFQNQTILSIEDSETRFPIPSSIKVKSLDNSVFRLKEARHGTFLYSTRDIFIGWSLDVYGEWCEEELNVLRQAISPGDVVLDVGAHIGTFTVPFAKWVGPTGRVHAFEPQRWIFTMLNANIALNGLMQVHTYRQAVGAKRGVIHTPELNLNDYHNTGGIPLAWYADHDGDSVPVIAIDSLQLDRCNFIKLDAELMEPDALKGATRTIIRHKPILYVENEGLLREEYEMSDLLVLTLDYLGYGCYWLLAPLFSPNNYFQVQENLWNPPHGVSSANMICFHYEKHRNVALPVVQLSGKTSLTHQDDRIQAYARLRQPFLNEKASDPWD